jgi:hypothetical protein
MPVNVEQFTSAGLSRVDWGVAINSYFNGTTSTALANGADSSMGQLLGADNFNLPPNQPNRVNIPGDDGSASQYLFEPTELPSGELVLGVLDANFASVIQGTKVYADGDHDVIVLGPADVAFADIVLITHSQAKSKHSGNTGSGFMVKIYPAVNALPLGDAGIANQAATNFTHALVANKFATLPWGVALSDTNHGTTEAISYGPFFSENRVILHTFIGDGSDTTVTLSKTPAAASGAKVKAWSNGTALVYGAGAGEFQVNTSTRVLTFGTAPAAGVKVVIRYEWV